MQDLILTNKIENIILKLISLKDDLTYSDLQGIVTIKTWEIIELIKKGA